MPGFRGRLAVAPMLDWTDRHFRHFARLLTARTTLYTEMVSDQAALHGPDRLLAFDRELEPPVVVQLGGSEPAALAVRAPSVAGEGARVDLEGLAGCGAQVLAARVH